MCGIVGYIGNEEAADILLEGLQRLEYRGYDSAGIAVINGDGLTLRREVGKLRNLVKEVAREPVSGCIGIGHTRWATHGRPTTFNAHPHTDCQQKLVVVHNGIIENYLLLKDKLLASGHTFRSDTDTEVIAHLIESQYQGDLVQAVRNALLHVEGAYALGVLHADHPDLMVGARSGSPLILGLSPEAQFLASDMTAILSHTRDIVFLEDGEVVALRQDGWQVTDLQGQAVAKTPTKIEWNLVAAEKGGFEHFMLKEIHEQPQALAQTLGGRLSESEGRLYLDELGLTPHQLAEVREVVLLACGTSYFAGLVGEHYLERIAKVPTSVEYASEYRYREPVVGPHTLVVAISQSGETADTLAALREAKALGGVTTAIVNVQGSAISREAQGNLFMRVGPEIGVASTKAYVATVASLYMLALHMAQAKGRTSTDEMRPLLHTLKQVPHKIEEVLSSTGPIEEVAAFLSGFSNCLFLGRGVNYPTAQEGALKLKELSYIHAEALPSGEMKHGPIALLDPNFPVIGVATRSHVQEKVISNLEEAKARDAVTIVLATEGDSSAHDVADYLLTVPEVPEMLSPLVNVVPMQLLAYHVAHRKGCDVDQPRNLAKSVTVE